MNKQGQTQKIVVLGLGQRGNLYADYAIRHKEKFELVAIIENNPLGLQKAKSRYPDVELFTSFQAFLSKKIKADVVAIATQDKDHCEHAIAFLKAGYNLLLEKPIATTIDDIMTIYNTSKKYRRKVVVCHVLRYTPFFQKVKKIIESGQIGDIVNLNASENIGFYHFANSFVRGPWRNKETASPIILAKSSHDMDIIRYLIAKPCLSINSYGSLNYFTSKNKPAGATKYCSDCKVQDCIYNAFSLYTSTYGSWCRNYFVATDVTNKELARLLSKTQYDRCVFQNDNNVVDHQVCIMRFANEINVTFTMTAFSKDIYRDLKIHGTKAELIGHVENNTIEVRHFTGEIDHINVKVEGEFGGHSGGDEAMLHALYLALNGEEAPGITMLDDSIESHLMAFGAEKSRMNNGQTILIESMKENEKGKN